MNCEKALELMKEYITGELNSQTRFMIKKHFQGCSSCNKEYIKMKEVILNDTKNSTTIDWSIPIMSVSARKRRRWEIIIPSVAAVLFLTMFIFASSVIAFPTFASKVLPEVPLVKQLLETKYNQNTTIQENQKIKKLNEQIKKENAQIKKENEQIKKENEKLETELDLIFNAMSENSILQVQTSEGIKEEDNNIIQSLAVDFIETQYKGDIEKLKAMSCDELKLQIDEKKELFLKNNKADVKFRRITNVSKSGDKYLVFVRLSDSSDSSDYQINLEFVKKNEDFYVSNVDYDI